MNDDKRGYETLSLRLFFDDQMQHLKKLADELSRHLLYENQQMQNDKQIVENFVDAANRQMRAVHGYTDKLRTHVKTLHNHVLQVANAIPPPIDVTPHSFGEQPQINALFANSEDIDKLFDTDPEAGRFLHTYDNGPTPVMFALLSAHKSEKRTLGVGALGDVLVRDVPQQVVNFSAHRIHAPCASSEELTIEVKKYLFDRVVTLLKQQMTARMIDQSPLSGVRPYELRVKSLANPDVYLKTLVEYLQAPEQLLSIDKIHFKLNKLGIRLDSSSGQSANEFDLHELTWSDRTRHVVLPIAYAASAAALRHTVATSPKPLLE